LYNKVRKVIKGGVISILKSGMIDGTDESPGSRVLADEFMRAGIEVVSMIDGDMTVMGTSIESLQVFVPRSKRFVTKARREFNPPRRETPKKIKFRKPQTNSDVMSISGQEVESDNETRRQTIDYTPKLVNLKRRSTRYDAAVGWSMPEAEETVEPPSPVLTRQATVVIESDEEDEVINVQGSNKQPYVETEIASSDGKPSASDRMAAAERIRSRGKSVRESIKKLQKEPEKELIDLQNYLEKDLSFPELSTHDKLFAIDQIVSANMWSYIDQPEWKKPKTVAALARLTEEIPLKMLEGALPPSSQEMYRACVNRLCVDRGIIPVNEELDFMASIIRDNNSMFPDAVIRPEDQDWSEFSAPSNRSLPWLHVHERFTMSDLSQAPRFAGTPEWDEALAMMNIDPRTKMGGGIAREVLADMAAQGFTEGNLKTAYAWLSKTTVGVKITKEQMEKVRNVKVESMPRRKTDSNKTMVTSVQDGKLLTLQKILREPIIDQRKFMSIREEFEISPRDVREIQSAYA